MARQDLPVAEVKYANPLLDTSTYIYNDFARFFINEPGFRVAYNTALVNPIDDTTLGTVTGICTLVVADTPLYSCTLEWTFVGKSVVSVGTLMLDSSTSTMAVVGGTGDYAGATGTLTHAQLQSDTNYYTVSFAVDAAV